MRVIAGTARGRRLVAPPGTTTRPTSERVREATFNALGSLGAVTDATVLDLFAGSGAMGVEALSRGAAHATFVDSDRQARSVIETNLAACGMADRATVLAVPAERYLVEADRSGAAFDLAFVDPPYGFDGWPDLLGVLPAELAVLESGREVDPPAGWVAIRSKRYGRAHVTFVERDREPPP